MAETAVLNRVNQKQLALFTGECAHHPNAASYVGSAREQLAQSGHAIDTAASRPGQALSNQAGGQAGSGSDEESCNRRYVGEITEHCVRYRPLHTGSIGAWFELSNACSSTIKVWHSSTSTDRFGALSIIKAGQLTKSWFNHTKMSGIRYVGCRETSDGRDVHFDEKLQRCFIHLKR